jgi:hypothetical protein
MFSACMPIIQYKLDEGCVGTAQISRLSVFEHLTDPVRTRRLETSSVRRLVFASPKSHLPSWEQPSSHSSHAPVRTRAPPPPK